MSDDLDARLTALFPVAPWRKPAPLPPLASGDTELDEAVAALEGPWDPQVRARELLAKKAGANVDRYLAYAERVARECPPLVWRADAAEPAIPEELRARANALWLGEAVARNARAMTVRFLLSTFDDIMDDALRDRFVREIDGAGAALYRRLLIESLLGWPGPYAATTKPRLVASPRHLEAVARHLVPGDEIADHAAAAAVALDPSRARQLVEALLASLPAAEREASVFAISKWPTTSAFDADPRWVDLFAPVLAGPWPMPRLDLGMRLIAVKTSAPLLKALAYVTDDALFTDVLGALRGLDEPSAAAPLTELAATLPDAEKKGARGKKAALAVAKRLARKRAPGAASASFTFTAAVGTDGGPVLVVPGEVLDDWQGASPQFGEPGAAEDDYSRACDAVSDDDIATLEVGGSRAVVVSQQACSFAPFGDDVLLVASGSELQVELASKERGGRRRLRETIEVGDAGLVLLDAAFDAKRAPEGALARVSVARGTYGIEVHRNETPSGLVLYARLSPAKAAGAKVTRSRRRSAD